MSRRLAALVLLLYPLAFRRRYGREMRLLVDEAPARLATVLDLLRGALAAHLHPPGAVAAVLDQDDRLRASASGILACWVAFAAAGFGFAMTTEDSPFGRVGNSHPLLGDAHAAIQALAIVASVAVVVGALPLIVIALNHVRRWRALRVCVGVPIVAMLAFVGLTELLVWLAHSQHAHHATSASRGLFVVWGFAGLACGAACVLASRRALFALPLARRWLLAAFAFGTLVTVAMLAIATATALYTVVLAIDASRLAASPNGPLDAPNVSISLVLQLLVMILAGTLAATTTHRGWRAFSLPAGASDY